MGIASNLLVLVKGSHSMALLVGYTVRVDGYTVLMDNH